MPYPGRKKAPFSIPTPQITNFDFGKWPLAEPKIREWLRDHGLTPEEIELFVDQIRKAKFDERESGRTEA